MAADSTSVLWLVGSGGLRRFALPGWVIERAGDRVLARRASRLSRDELSSALDGEGSVKKDTGDKRCWRAAGRFVKRWRLDGVRRVAAPNYALRWVDGTAAIGAIGLATPAVEGFALVPLASLRAGRTTIAFGAREVSCVMEWIDGRPLSSELAAAAGPRQVALAREAARLLADLHDSGVVNDDSTADNLLVAADGRIVFTDLDALRVRRRPIAWTERARSLAQMNWSFRSLSAVVVAVRGAFFDAYLGAAARPPHGRLAFWREVKRRSLRLAEKPHAAFRR
jgi:tRNA A-37 threonylcarbamoyl transferase component Bud32